MSRPRRARREYRVTLEVLNAAVDLAAWEAHWGGHAQGRAAWDALRSQIRMNPGHAPAPFWAYEPDVPEALRALAHSGGDPGLEEAGREWLELRGL